MLHEKKQTINPALFQQARLAILKSPYLQNMYFVPAGKIGHLKITLFAKYVFVPAEHFVGRKKHCVEGSVPEERIVV